MKIKNPLIYLTLLSSLFVCGLSAANLFSVTVTDAGRNLEVTRGDSKFLPLISDSVESDGAFQAFDNSLSYTGTITYFGIPDAINLSRSRTVNGETARLQSRLTGLDRSFSAATEEQLEEDIEDFFLEEGADELAKLEKAVAKNSAAAISDGNPNSTTALAASDSFASLGFSTRDVQGALNRINGEKSSQGSGGFSVGMGIGLNAGSISIDTPSGDSIEGTKLATQIPYRFNFGKRLRLIGSIPLDWTDLAGTQVYGGGTNAGLQYDVIPVSAEKPWGWKVAPMAGVSGRGTVDGATGTLLYQAGFTSAFTYVIPKKALFTFGSQISHFESIPIKIQGTELEADIDQQILKNGLKVGVPFGKRMLGDLYVINTAFLKDAAVSNYWTFGTGLSYRLTKTGMIGLHFNVDDGEDYSSYNVGLSSAWRF